MRVRSSGVSNDTSTTLSCRTARAPPGSCDSPAAMTGARGAVDAEVVGAVAGAGFGGALCLATEAAGAEPPGTETPGAEAPGTEAPGTGAVPAADGAAANCGAGDA